MPLTDQQLREELLNYGETVPPITSRNRQQLQIRLTELQRARKRPIPGLIELSDSENETPIHSQRISRSTIPKPTKRFDTNNDVISEVEQSIARRRQEIDQLIKSTRERASFKNSNFPPSEKSFRPTTTTTNSNSNRPTTTKTTNSIRSPLKFNNERIKQFWKTYRQMIIDTLKALLVGAIIGGALILLKSKGQDLIPHRKGISCSIDNATDCDEMIPMVESIKKQLQIRAGEVDCGFRPKNEIFMTKREIEKYLDQKGFLFELGSEERWKTLVTYIIDKPVETISVWNLTNGITDEVSEAAKLSSSKLIRSLSCRVRKNVHSAMQNLAWLAAGTCGFLSLLWLLRRCFHRYEEKEKNFKETVQKILEQLETQYDESRVDSEIQPHLAINHLRDSLIPAADRKKQKEFWDRIVKHINERESRVRAETVLIHGEECDVWRWIQPRSSSPSPTRRKRTESPSDDQYVHISPDVGLTECLKLRNFFDAENGVDDDEIDLVVDNIQNRCATVKRIEHIGIHSIFVYLKFSSKQASAQGYHLLNNWRYHNRNIIAKYIRLERYYNNFPEARETGSN